MEHLAQVILIYLKFSDDGVYSFSKHQGYVYNINSKNVYISLLYVLIFFLTAFLLLHLKQIFTL